jgi:hypothetical protein
LLALLGAHHILHVSRKRVKGLIPSTKLVFNGTPNVNKTGNSEMYNVTFRRISATTVAVGKSNTLYIF